MSNMKIKQIKKGKIWLFFEEKEIRLTQLDEIITRKIQVNNSLTAMIRWTLDNETHSNIQECFLNVAQS